jgi:hypothetical protein
MCGEAPNLFDEEQAHMKNINKHIGEMEDYYTCKFCSKMLTSFNSAQIHVKTCPLNKEAVRMTCKYPHCNKTFSK